MNSNRYTRFRCFYCLVQLQLPVPDPVSNGSNNHDNIRTREHLIPLVDGGDSNPDNVRWACRLCNNYVGCWSLERKLRFRVLIRRVGSVNKLRSMFPKQTRGREVAALIDSISMPQDVASHRARMAAYRIEREMIDRYKKVSEGKPTYAKVEVNQ